MSSFLSESTKGATDLQPGYAGIVQAAWDAFYASDCGPDDLTCGSAHEQLGR